MHQHKLTQQIKTLLAFYILWQSTNTCTKYKYMWKISNNCAYSAIIYRIFPIKWSVIAVLFHTTLILFINNIDVIYIIDFALFIIWL